MSAVALHTCTDSLSGRRWSHWVEATAESVYDAAVLGVSTLRSSGWAGCIAPGTELEIQVREPATSLRRTVRQIQRW